MCSIAVADYRSIIKVESRDLFSARGGCRAITYGQKWIKL